MRRLLCLLTTFVTITIAAQSAEPIQPLQKIDVDSKKAKLGALLFEDKRLSIDNTVSCASCHDLEKGGSDWAPRSTGVKGQLGDVNSPTVFNSAHNFVQFWDGRAKDLQDQAAGPVENPVEMADNWQDVVKKISADPKYETLFEAIYQEQPSKDNITDAIAEFEKTLITPSRFDRYLAGDQTAITAEEKHGYELFKSYGCTACHNGMNVGGNMYQKFGLVKDYFADRGHVTKADYGRYNVTNNEADRYFFKVPTLRNVAITPPYFHDGSTYSLTKAIQTMGKYQLGRDINDDDAKAIAAFLTSLTGEGLEKQIPEAQKVAAEHENQ